MRVVIIGGGLSGLCAAWTLQESGHEAIILERNACPGGNVQSTREAGFLVESGPNTLQVAEPALDALLEQNGAADRSIEANPDAAKRYVVRNQQPMAVPQSLTQALRTSLFDWPTKSRIACEPFIPASNHKEESLANFVRRRLGQDFLDYAINPMVGGVYAGDPESLSTCYGFPKVFQLEKEYGSLTAGALSKMLRKRHSKKAFRSRLISWPNGMQELVNQLARALNIRVNATIQSITRTNQKWSIQWKQDNTTEHVHADQLIVATPAHVLTSLPFDKELSKVFEPLNKIPHPPVSVYALGFKTTDIRHPLDGFGMLVPEKEKANILGTLFSSTLFPDRAPDGHVLLTSFVGGTRQPHLAKLETNELHAKVMESLHHYLGVCGEPVYSRRVHWERAIPQYTLDHRRVARLLNEIEKQYPGLYLIGNYRDGIAAGKCMLNASQRMAQTL